MPLENKDIVKAYHEKLTDIRVRIPAPNDELGIPDYLEMIRTKALKEGFIDRKTKQGSANAYILSLIEKDLGITMIKGYRELKNNSVDE
jgi:hypothetical protein